MALDKLVQTFKVLTGALPMVLVHGAIAQSS